MPATNTAANPYVALIARALKVIARALEVRALPGFTGDTQAQIRAANHAFSRFLEAAADEKVYTAAGIQVRI